MTLLWFFLKKGVAILSPVLGRNTDRLRSSGLCRSDWHGWKGHGG
jgi:hypothetical protein